MELSKLLASLPAFQGLPESDLAAFMQCAVGANYPDGHTFFSAGGASQAMYLLVDGSVRVSRHDDQGALIEASDLSTGEVFGLLGLVEGVAATSSAVTTSPSQIVEVSAGNFAALKETAPTAALRIQRMIAVQLARELQFRGKLLRLRMLLDAAT
jgi:CRP/FNR family cyclic AMP-dependent transcriptional regulator